MKFFVVLLVALAVPAQAAAYSPAAPMVAQECPGVGGACFTNGTLYIGSSPDRFATAHEVGHAFDSEVLTDEMRTSFQRRMRAPEGPWSTGTGFPAGLQSPNEWFADYFAVCTTGINPRRGWPDSYAPRPPLQRFFRVCTAIKMVMAYQSPAV